MSSSATDSGAAAGLLPRGTDGPPDGTSRDTNPPEEAGGGPPRCTRRERMASTPRNPQGYPPFNIKKLLSYTNRQIRYYAAIGKLEATPAVGRALQRRRAFLE